MRDCDPVNGTAVIGVEGTIGPSGDVMDVIAGYQLERRLGIGSYGEVWKAVGPGGLPKAVKILHGGQAGALADMELKSLERIRDLRHPFLLNIERIEIDRDRVVIVTELADRNLEDRFREAQREKKPGIPRDELLRYLRETADALDFIYQEQQLQHLDIKPENLMLQGDHIKVGDFGLAKRVNQTSASMVGGFTPLYAPPEVFEGTPGPTSDQYSLAIVYQVMLTGTPPFAGRTAAQLMSQHLRSKPDLTPLPPADRSTVARALSKTPSARFETCRDFVDALISRRPSGTHARPVSAPPRSKTAAETEESVPPAPEAPAAGGPRRSRERSHESRPLPALDVDPTETRPRPALFIGLGGVGGHVVSTLQSRFRSRFGEPRELPSFAFLHVDSDVETLNSIQGGTSGRTAVETLPIPLADPNDYRAKSSGLLEWLSRRWLFNIPRSRKVQSMRPLGRLALFDHRNTVRARLKSLLQRITSGDAVRQTTAETGLALESDFPEVYVITSTGGGTGSGAVVDVGYLLRDLFVELEFPRTSLYAFLLPGTSPYGTPRQVELGNSVACLQELAHFGRPGLEYSSGFLRALSSTNAPPFDQTYVVSLGDGLEEEAFVQELRNVTEYLYANTVGPARAFFETWRRSQREQESSSAGYDCVRTIGLATPDALWRKRQHYDAARLCYSLLSQWRVDLERFVTQTGIVTPGGSGRGNEMLAPFGLTTAAIDREVMQTVAQVTRQDLAPRLASQPRETLDSPQALLGHYRRMAAEIEMHPERLSTLAAALGALRNQSAARTAAAIEEITRRVMDHWRIQHYDLNGTLGTLLDVQLHLRTLLKELRQSSEAIDRQCMELLTLRTDEEVGAGDESLHAAGERACALSVARKLYEHYQETAAAVSAGTRTLFEEFSRLGPLLDDLCRRFETLEFTLQRELPGIEQPQRYDSRASDTHRLLPPVIVNAFRTWLCQSGRVDLVALMRQETPTAACAGDLQHAATSFLLRSPLEGLDPPGMPSNELSRGLIPAAQPKLAYVEGGHRVLAVVPRHETPEGWRSALAEEFSDCASVATGEIDDLLVCCEVEGIAIEAVSSELAGWDPKVFEIAGRVHTRIDIEW